MAAQTSAGGTLLCIRCGSLNVSAPRSSSSPPVCDSPARRPLPDSVRQRKITTMNATKRPAPDLFPSATQECMEICRDGAEPLMRRMVPDKCPKARCFARLVRGARRSERPGCCRFGDGSDAYSRPQQRAKRLNNSTGAGGARMRRGAAQGLVRGHRPRTGAPRAHLRRGCARRRARVSQSSSRRQSVSLENWATLTDHEFTHLGNPRSHTSPKPT